MATLHILSCAPADQATIARLSVSMSDGDAVMLIQNAVYLAHHVDWLVQLSCPCFALSADLKARAVTVQAPVTLVTDAEFVQLTCDYDKSVSWFTP